MNKQLEYQKLVSARKACRLCKEYGMTNQSATQFDSASIGKWTDWQGNIDAKVMVIGQDWGSLDYWNKNQGNGTDTNPTNCNLMQLSGILGFDIGVVSNPNRSEPIFFTNSVLCLKDGNMSSPVLKKCYYNCGSKFLKPQIDIIKPQVIISLGYAPYASILELYRPIGIDQIRPLRDVIRKEPINFHDEDFKLFPVYHCGGLGLANRKLDEQKKDWENIKRWL